MYKEVAQLSMVQTGPSSTTMNWNSISHEAVKMYLNLFMTGMFLVITKKKNLRK